MSRSKNNPTVEGGGSAFAAAARLDADIRSRALDKIAESHLFAGYESGQPHPERSATLLLRLGGGFDFLFHPARLAISVANKDWYAAAASSKGGITDVRRGAEV